MDLDILSTTGPLVCHCVRLHRGDDLLRAIRSLAIQEKITAGVVLSAVGCISEGRIRDASGITIRQIHEHCEIVSITGTVSARRCHLHIALSREDLSTIGGHLTHGCIINTTCELVIAQLPHVRYDMESDPETGYDELIFQEA